MASRKQKKANAAPATDPVAATVEQKSVAQTANKKATKKGDGRRTATTRRGPGRPKGSKTKTRAANKSPAKQSGRPRRYTPAERAKILAAAKREGLTGNQVAKKFNISTVTYYLWRKKVGSTTGGQRKGRAARPRVESADFSGQLREAIRVRVREMLPEIIEQEIGANLGRPTGRRRGPR